MSVRRIAVVAFSVDMLLSAQALRWASTKTQSTLAPAPLSACSDDTQMCAAWAARGECEMNPGWMLENCRQSCGLCSSQPAPPPPPTPAPCTDNNQMCAGWAATGECEANPGFMLGNCRQSCGLCASPPTPPPTPAPCTDNNQMCAGWAATGECEANPGFMLENCCVSCSSPITPAWDDLNNTLTGRLTKVEEGAYDECREGSNNAFEIAERAGGLCFQSHVCSREKCAHDAPLNLPSHIVEALSVADVQAALNFANRYDLSVSVKTTGHSYGGSSTFRDSLQIWMRNFPRRSQNGVHNFTDSCGATHQNVIEIGGGEVWSEVYDAVGEDFDVVGGGCTSVSASGGWLQGGGLSTMSRYHGMGADNVLSFEVVLADGSQVVADSCSNSDLFWALRGGGGGTFGVVTGVQYKVHNAEPMLLYEIVIGNEVGAAPREVFEAWFAFWVQKSPSLGNRWMGYGNVNKASLYFLGSIAEAESTFITALRDWHSNLAPAQREYVRLSGPWEFNSQLEFWGGRDGLMHTVGAMENRDGKAWLVPESWLIDEPQAVVDFLLGLLRIDSNVGLWVPAVEMWLIWLGGVMHDVDAAATAVNPAYRRSIWDIEAFGLRGEEVIAQLRALVPTSKGGGAGLNHAAPNEPDWENAIWGSNLAQLKTIKEKYDPGQRFKAWMTVGYQEPDHYHF